MIKNYFKIVFRNLWRYKGYSFINIIGMAIGIAAMVWGYQVYQYSFSFDDFHKDKDNVYRVLSYQKDADQVKGVFPMAALKQVQQDFSGVKEAVRYDSRGMNVKYDKSDAFAENVYFTDPAFFDLFNFPLVAGSNDLSDQNAVMITEKVAKKYFGKQAAVGKVLTMYAGETYAMPLTVKGVLKDVPANSTMQFNILTNFNNQLKSDGQKIAPDDWGFVLDAAFFRIPDAANAARLENEMKKYLPLQNKAKQDFIITGFKCVSLRKHAGMREMISWNALYTRPGEAAANGPLILAFLIFLSACLNFSNTTVGRASRRLKEIGMRKVMGSTHAQLMKQLLLECAVIVAAAIALSVLFNRWWIPMFNQMFEGVHVEANYLQDYNLFVFIALMFAGATLLAGAYPAFYVSRFSPTSIFRGSVKFGGSNLFSRLMLGLQLSIAVITVVAGLAFSRNAEFQRNYDFGFTIDNMMGVTLSDSSSYEALKNTMSDVPGITATAGTRNHIGFDSRSVVGESEGVKKELDYYEVGRDYLTTMNLKIAKGREFDAGLESDYNNALLITQKTAADYGWNEKQALGKTIHIDSMDFSVVGVMKDLKPQGFFSPHKPIAMKLGREKRFKYLIIQAAPKDLSTVYAKTQDVWKRLFPLKPFSGFYQNEMAAESYKTTVAIAKIFSWFAIVCILLTATGLFALVSLTAMKKMREIALRKVVGASPHHIVALMNRGYVWIFIIASLLGCVAGYAFTKLMLDLIFKVNAGVEIASMVWSVVLLLLIAALTSGIKVWQALRTNPVKVLRAD